MSELLKNVEDQVGYDRLSELNQDIQAQRLYALMSETYDFFTVCALTEIERQELLLESGLSGADFADLDTDSQDFLTTPHDKLTTDDVLSFAAKPVGKERVPLFARGLDNVWGNIALMIAEDEPLVAFKILGKITQSYERVIWATNALFQQPANIHIRRLIETTFHSGLRDSSLAWQHKQEPIHQDYLAFILGLTGDRVEADKAMQSSSVVDARGKSTLGRLYQLPESTQRTLGYTYDQSKTHRTSLLSDIYSPFRILQPHKGAVSKDYIMQYRANYGQGDAYAKQHALALAITDKDPQAAFCDFEFNLSADITSVYSMLKGFKTNGVSSFALECDTDEGNINRDFHNWARVKLDVESDQVEAETVMRALAIPQLSGIYGTPVSHKLRDEVSSLLGFN